MLTSRPWAVPLAVVALVSGITAQAPPPVATRGRVKPMAENPGASRSILGDLDLAMDEVAQRVLPAVVQISVSGFGPSRERSGGENVI